MDNRGTVEKIRSEAVDRDVKALAKRVIRGIGFGACAYLAGLAELPFGARPFGVALLAASGRDAIFVYLGLVLSAFIEFEVDEAIIYFAVYSALLLLRIFSWVFVGLRENYVSGGGGVKRLFSKKMGVFGESVGMRTINSSIFGLALGASMLFAGGLLYYDLFGLLVIALLSPIATLLLCGYIEGGERAKKQGGRAGVFYSLGLLTLCAIAVYGAQKIVIYGASLSVVIGLIITFYVTCRHGVGYGSLGGLALGLCYSPMLSPLFVISALAMGVLARFSVALACFAAFFASCAWAFYVEGMSALLGAFGGILSACLLYSVIHKMLFADVKKNENEESRGVAREEQALLKCRVLPDSALDGVRLYEMNMRTSAISDGLYKLSMFFDELRSSGGGVFDDEICVEKYNNIFSGEVSLIEYKALSALLAKSIESEQNEYVTDRELSLKLCQALTDLRLEIYGVLLYGVRKKIIFIRCKSRDALEKNAEFIIEAIAPILPFAISRDAFEIRRDGEKGGALFIFEREKNSASVIRRRVSAVGESVCGDSVCIFKNKEDRFFALLSDGMGSGHAASAISGVSVGFLSNMLTLGGLNDELIEMLNGFLCMRFQKSISECSATLDLFELDLMSGRALFYKCGAAPSYVYRRGRLFKLRSDSMPIGILSDVDIKKYELELSHGDVVVMVSDGVTGEGSECPWLFDLLAQNLPNRSLEHIAELIVKYATAKGSGDDITVLLIRVE